MSLSGHTSLDITVITAFLTCQRSVKLNEGRQRKVKSSNKTNESQSGARRYLPEVRGKLWGKVNFRPPEILVTY